MNRDLHLFTDRHGRSVLRIEVRPEDTSTGLSTGLSGGWLFVRGMDSIMDVMCGLLGAGDFAALVREIEASPNHRPYELVLCRR